MRWLNYFGIMLLIALVGIQFIPIKLNQSAAVPLTDFIKAKSTPESIALILKVSCYDCHSNNTNYPWYSYMQPSAWLLEKHIRKGKEELNFSEFESYSDRKQKSKLRAMVGQIENDEMPLLSYTFIHSEAKLSQDEKNALIEYLNFLKESI